MDSAMSRQHLTATEVFIEAVDRYHDWLARPIGPLHWAGTETSYEWEGHVEGAVRAGNRVAAEVAAALESVT